MNNGPAPQSTLCCACAPLQSAPFKVVVAVPDKLLVGVVNCSDDRHTAQANVYLIRRRAALVVTGNTENEHVGKRGGEV